MFKITLDDTKVKKSLDGLAKGVQNFQEPLNKASEKLMDVYGNRTFEEQGAAGEKWRPLSAATLMARKNRWGYYKQAGTDGKTLIWTGRLRAGFRKKVNRVKLVIDNTVSYFKYHQERGGKTPQRRMLFLNADTIKTVFDEVDRYVKKITK